MKRTLILFLLLACALLPFGCSGAVKMPDPYENYLASSLEYKDVKADVIGDIVDSGVYGEKKYNNWNDLKLLVSFEDYSAYGLELGYTEGYFENNDLAVILQTSCSSDGFKFTDVLQKDGKLYPVIERNYIGPNEAVTDDIIFHLKVIEIDRSLGYSLGEISYKYRNA